ncbi:MAG: hypothetical protein HY072_05145 [Deltaproteobacteria bacterium]|nr:hypothetical protein [Deltaproteobacteria bacterium]
MQLSEMHFFHSVQMQKAKVNGNEAVAQMYKDRAKQDWSVLERELDKVKNIRALYDTSQKAFETIGRLESQYELRLTNGQSTDSNFEKAHISSKLTTLLRIIKRSSESPGSKDDDLNAQIKAHIRDMNNYLANADIPQQITAYDDPASNGIIGEGIQSAMAEIDATYTAIAAPQVAAPPYVAPRPVAKGTVTLPPVTEEADSPLVREEREPASGPAGAVGKDGAVGPQGPTGVAGKDGTNGKEGAKGDAGKSVSAEMEDKEKEFVKQIQAAGTAAEAKGNEFSIALEKAKMASGNAEKIQKEKLTDFNNRRQRFTDKILHLNSELIKADGENDQQSAEAIKEEIRMAENDLSALNKEEGKYQNELDKTSKALAEAKKILGEKESLALESELKTLEPDKGIRTQPDAKKFDAVTDLAKKQIKFQQLKDAIDAHMDTVKDNYFESRLLGKDIDKLKEQFKDLYSDAEKALKQMAEERLNKTLLGNYVREQAKKIGAAIACRQAEFAVACNKEDAAKSAEALDKLLEEALQSPRDKYLLEQIGKAGTAKKEAIKVVTDDTKLPGVDKIPAPEAADLAPKKKPAVTSDIIL